MSRDRAVRGVAEFIVLVVGVLLALFAENWVSTRADAHRASSYQRDLQADLMQDTVILRIWTGIAQDKLKSAALLSDEVDGVGASLSPAETLVALYHVQYRFTPRLGSATYADLQGSGDLRLLLPETRRALVLYEDRAESTVRISSGLLSPMNRGMVPGAAYQALAECSRTCGDQAYVVSEPRLLALADTLFEKMTPAQQNRVMGWQEVEDIARLLDHDARESGQMLRELQGLLPLLMEALASVTAS